MARVAVQLLAVRQFRGLNITNPSFLLVCKFRVDLGGLPLECQAYILRKFGS
jgi:hypothetical protein